MSSAVASRRASVAAHTPLDTSVNPLGTSNTLAATTGSLAASTNAATTNSGGGGPANNQETGFGGPAFVETTPAGLSLVNEFNSDTATFKNLDFTKLLYDAFLVPYTQELTHSGAFLPTRSTSTWIQQRILDQSHNPLSSTGSDGMVTYDQYRHVRSGLASALGVLIDDGEYDCQGIGLVDTFLEAMALAAQLSWTALQLQQFLLLLQQTHSDVTWLQGDDEMQLKTVVGQLLTKRLSRLCAKQEVPGFEKFIVEEAVVEEVTDPQAIAALEAKMKDAKGKQKQTMAEMIAQLPKIKVTNIVTKETVEEKVVIIDPYYSTTDAIEITNFIRGSFLQHWRLYRFAATVPRSVDTTEFNLAVEDLPRKLDNLADAVTQLDFEQTNERQDFWNAMVEEIEDDFDYLFVCEVNAIYADFVGEDTVARIKNDREVAEDEANAMSADEFKRSVQVLKHRLQKKENGGGGSGAAGGDNSSSAISTADADELNGIEERIKKLENAVAAQNAAPAKPGKK